MTTIKLKGMEEIVTIKSLRPNAWNPNVQTPFLYEREKASIRKFGFVLPIITRINEDDKIEIIDGEHRWKAVKELHAEGIKLYSTPPPEEGQPDDRTPLPKGNINIKNMGKINMAQAKQLTVLMNELKGSADTVKLADLMKDLSEQVPLGDLLEVMPYTKEEMDGLIKLPDFDWENFDKGANIGGENDQWITVKYRLPQAAANVIQSAIERLIREVPLTGKNVEARALELMAADCLATAIESYR